MGSDAEDLEGGLGANLHSMAEVSGVSTVLTVSHTCSRTVTCALTSNLSLSSTFCSIQGPGLLKDVVMFRLSLPHSGH